MALGVLNNLSAIYAENNLNNTSNSLQKVLQQLSSGSRINSGADDAAGLSLVNGLGANSAALTQSKTNATEGAGLLQVADGALSQVTNLLNRAITLATEASNGTLNATQEGAANQEYQSILSEINNIGQTTTFNQQQVFNGKQVAIYTGDSSTTGSSVDLLYIRALSEASVGDSGGVMAYSDGSNSVFINLSHTDASTGAVTNAQATDSLNQSGTTTINVNYLVKGANGSEAVATTSISVGGTTGIANTVNGLISAINNSGLGLTASFSSQSAAGVAGGGTQTGIEISGGLVSVGVDPSAASTSGTLSPSGIKGSDLTQGQVVNITVGGVSAASVTIDSSTSTLDQLAAAINHPNHQVAQNALVTATVITANDGSKTLSLADASNTGGALLVNVTPSTNSGNSLGVGTTIASSSNPVTMTVGSSSNGIVGNAAQVTLGLGTAGASHSTDVLSGTIVLSNQAAGAAANGISFVMGSGPAVGNGAGTLSQNGHTFTVNGNTLANLAAAISSSASGLGATATIGSSGLTITSSTTGTTLQQVGASALTTSAGITQQSNVAGAAASSGTDGSTTLTMNGGSGSFNANNVLTGKIVLTNGNSTTPGDNFTFTMGAASAVSNPSAGNHVYTTGGSSVNALITAINASTATSNMTATLNASGQIVLNSTAPYTTIAVTPGAANNTLTTQESSVASTVTASTASVAAVSTGATFTIGAGQIGAGNLSNVSTDDVLTGNVVISNGSASNPSTVTYTMGGAGATTGYGTSNVAVQGNTLAALFAAVNGDSADSGITATMNAAGNGFTMNTGTTTGTSIGVNSSGLTDASAFTSAHVNATATETGSVTLANGGMIPGNGGAGSGALSGSIVLSNNLGSGLVTDTFVMGGNAANDGSGTFYVGAAGSTLNALIAKISAQSATLGLTASQDATSGGLALTSTGADTGLAITSSLTDTIAAATGVGGTNGVAGATNTQGAVTITNSRMTATPANAGAGGDILTGSIVLQNAGGGTYGTALTFAMGTGAAANTYYAGSQVDGNTLLGLQEAINQAIAAHPTMDMSTSLSGGALTITSTHVGGSAITESANTLVDTAAAMAGVVTASAPSAQTNSAGAAVGTGVAAINGNAITGTGDTLGGTIVLSNNGHTDTFVMGSNAANSYTGNTTNVINVAGTKLSDLLTAINGETTDGAHATASLSLTAALNAAGTGLTFTPSAAGTSIAVNSSALTETSTLSFTTPASGNLSQNQSGVIALTDGGKLAASTSLATLGQSLGTLAGSIVVSNAGVTDTFVMGSSTANTYSSSGSTIHVSGTSVNALISAVNSAGATSGLANGQGSLNLTASQDLATGGIFVQSNTPGTNTLSATTTGLTISLAETGANGTDGSTITNTAAHVVFSNGGSNSGTDPVSGSIVVTNTAAAGGAYNGGAITFVVGQGTNDATHFYTQGTVASPILVDSQGNSTSSLQGLADLINTTGPSHNGDFSASVGPGGLTLTSGDATSVITVNSSTLQDQYGAITQSTVAGTGPSGATTAAATVGITTGAVGATDQLAGTLVLSNGASGNRTFVMGAQPGSGPAANTIYTGSTTTLASLQQAINSDSATLGVNASISNGILNLQAINTQTTITVGATSNLTDTVTENVAAPATGILSTASTATITLGGSGSLSGSDVLAGSFTVSANGVNGGNPITFVMGNGAASGGGSGTFSQNGNTFTVNGNTLNNLTSALNNELGVQTGIGGVSNRNLILTTDAPTSTPISISVANTNLQDAGTAAQASVASLGSFASLSDNVTGSISFNLAGANGTPGATQTITTSGTTTVQGLLNQINTGNKAGTGTTVDPYGVHASATLTANGFYSVTLTSDTYGQAGEIQNSTGKITDQAITANLSYAAGAAYETGISSGSIASGTAIYDSSSGQTDTLAGVAGITSNNSGSSGIATISYSDGAGQALNGTDLLNQADAQAALTALNSAITDVAAQDGYIGAQINTLNSISQVMSTQQENVVSAQNAIQATDYASATSNMSKYEILSQTGIAALAQANTVQQEVTKLLQ